MELINTAPLKYLLKCAQYRSLSLSERQHCFDALNSAGDTTLSQFVSADGIIDGRKLSSLRPQQVVQEISSEFATFGDLNAASELISRLCNTTYLEPLIVARYLKRHEEIFGSSTDVDKDAVIGALTTRILSQFTSERAVVVSCQMLIYSWPTSAAHLAPLSRMFAAYTDFLQEKHPDLCELCAQSIARLLARLETHNFAALFPSSVAGSAKPSLPITASRDASNLTGFLSFAVDELFSMLKLLLATLQRFTYSQNAITTVMDVLRRVLLWIATINGNNAAKTTKIGRQDASTGKCSKSLWHIRACCALITMSVIETYFDLSEYMDVLSISDELFQPVLFYWAALRTGSATPAATHASEADVVARTFRSGMLMSFNSVLEDDPDFLEYYLRQNVREKLYMPFLNAVLSRNYWRCYMHSFNFRTALCDLIYSCLSLPSCAAQFWQGLLLEQTSQPIAFIEYGNWLHMHPVASQLQYSAISGLLRSIGSIDAPVARRALAMLEQHIWSLKYVTVEAGEDLFTRGIAQRRQRQMIGQHQLLQIVLRDDLVVPGVDGLVLPAGAAGIILGDLSRGFTDEESDNDESSEYSINNNCANDNVFLKFSLQTSTDGELEADDGQIDDGNNSIWRSVLSCIKTFREFALDVKPSLNELNSSDICVKIVSAARLLLSFVESRNELSSGGMITGAGKDADAARRYLSRIVAITEEFHTAFQVFLALIEAKQTSDSLPINVAELLQLSMRITFELARVRFTRYDFDKLVQVMPKFVAGGPDTSMSFVGIDAVNNTSDDTRMFFADESNISSASMLPTTGADAYMLSNVSKWWRILVTSCMSADVDERSKRRLFQCVDVLLDMLSPTADDLRLLISPELGHAASPSNMDLLWLEKAPSSFYGSLRSAGLFVVKLLAPPMFAAARGRPVELRILKLLLLHARTDSEFVEETELSPADQFRHWLCATINTMLVEGTVGVSIVDLMRSLSYDFRVAKFDTDRQTLASTAMLIVRTILNKITDARKQQKSDTASAVASSSSAAVDGGGAEPVSSLHTLFERELFANAGPSMDYSPITNFTPSYAPKRIMLQRNAEANLCALAVYATLANADNQSRIIALNTLALIVDNYRFPLTGCLGDKVATELRFSIMDQLLPLSQPSSKPVASDDSSSSLLSLNVENADLTNACLRLLSHSMPNHLPFVEPYLNCMYERMSSSSRTTLSGISTAPKSPLTEEADFFTRKKLADAASLLDVLMCMIADDPNFAVKVTCGDGCRSVQRAAFDMLTTLWSKQYYVAVDYIMQYHSTLLYAAIRRIIEQACSSWFEMPLNDTNATNNDGDAEEGMATEGAVFLLSARLDTLNGVLRLLAAQLMLQEWQVSSRPGGVSEYQRKTDRQWDENVWSVFLKTNAADDAAQVSPLFDELAKVFLIKIPKLLNKRMSRADKSNVEVDIMDIENDDGTRLLSEESSENNQLTFRATDSAFAWRNFMLIFMAASDKTSLSDDDVRPTLPASRQKLHAIRSGIVDDSTTTSTAVFSTPISPVRTQKLIVRLLASMQKWFSEPHYVSDSYKAAVMGFAKQVFLKHYQFFSTFALTALARLNSIVFLLCGAEGLTQHTDLARSVILCMIEPVFDSLSASPAALVIVGTDSGRSAPPAIAAAVSSSSTTMRGGGRNVLYPNLSALMMGGNYNTTDDAANDDVVDDSRSFIAERLLLGVLSSLLDYFDSALERWATFGIDSESLANDAGNSGVVGHDAFSALKQVLDIICHVIQCMRAISPLQFEGTFFNQDAEQPYAYDDNDDDYDENEDEDTAGVTSGRPPLLGQLRSPHIVATTTTPRRRSLRPTTRSGAAGSVAVSRSSVMGDRTAPYDRYRWERIVLQRDTVSKCVAIAETCMKAVKYPKFVNSLLKLLYTMATEDGGRPNSAVCGSMHACDLVSRLGWAFTSAFRPEFDHRVSSHYATWTENLTMLCDTMHACLLERRRSTLVEADIVDFFASLNWRNSIVRLYSIIDSNKWALPATQWQQRVSDTLAACIRLMGAVYQNVFVEYALFYDNHARMGGFTKRFFTDLTPPKQLVLDGFMRLSSHVLNSLSYAFLSTNFGRSRRHHHHHKRTPSTGETGGVRGGRSSEGKSLSRAASSRRKEAAADKDAATTNDDSPKQPLHSGLRRNTSTSPRRAAHLATTGRDPEFIKRVLIASKAQFQMAITALHALNTVLPELDELALAKPLSKLPFSQYFLQPSFSLPSFTSSLSGDGRATYDAAAQPLNGRKSTIYAPVAASLHTASVASNIGFAREFDLSYGTLLSLCSSCIDYLKEVMRLLTDDATAAADNNADRGSGASKTFTMTSDEQSQLTALQIVINETLDCALLLTIKHGLLHLRVAVDNEFAVQVCGGFDEKLGDSARNAAVAAAPSAAATSATVCTELHQELKSIVRQLDRHSAHNLSGLQDSSASSQSHSQEDFSSLSVLGQDGSPGAGGLRKYGGGGGGLSRDSSVILPCTIPHELKEAETLRDLLLFIIVYEKPFKFNDRQLAMVLNASGRKSSTSSQPRPAALVGLSGSSNNAGQQPQQFAQSLSNTQYSAAYSPSMSYNLPSASSVAPTRGQQKLNTPSYYYSSPIGTVNNMAPYSTPSPSITAVAARSVLPSTSAYTSARLQPYVNSTASPRSPVWGFGGLFR